MQRQGTDGACAAKLVELSDSDDGGVMAPTKAIKPMEACPPRTATADTRRPCQYGSKCYRKNPQHRAEYRHDNVPQLQAPSVSQTSRYFAAAPTVDDPVDLISDEDN